MVFNALFFLGIAGLCVIPFNSLIYYTTSLYRNTFRQVNKPKPFYISKSPFVFSLAEGLELLKGYSLLFIVNQFFDDDVILITTFGLGLLFHVLPIPTKQSYTGILAFLTGVFSSLWIGSVVLFPLLFGLFVLILNSVLLGFIVSLLTLSIIFWLVFISPFYLGISLSLILILILRYFDEILNLFRGKQETLGMLFENR